MCVVRLGRRAGSLCSCCGHIRIRVLGDDTKLLYPDIFNPAHDVDHEAVGNFLVCLQEQGLVLILDETLQVAFELIECVNLEFVEENRSVAADGENHVVGFRREDFDLFCLRQIDIQPLAHHGRSHHEDDEHDEHCCCGHHHDHDDDDEDEHEHHHHHDHDDDHDEHCCCGHHHHHHDHDADEVFTSWGVETAKKFSKADIEHALTELDTGNYGMILRSKGIVDGGADGWLEFDYVPGEWEVRARGADVGGKLVVIGSKLDEKGIAALFGC